MILPTITGAPAARARCALWRAMIAMSFALLITANGLAQTTGETAIPVSVETVKDDSRSATLQLVGTFVAQQRSMISSELAGVVASIDAEVGDVVAPGDALFSLDDTLATLTLKRLQASVEEGRARATDAARVARETEDLTGSGAVSSTVIASNRAASDEARAALASRIAAEQEQAERVARHVIRAPFGGVVADRQIDLGAWVAAGTPTFELVNTSALWLEVQFPENRFRSLIPSTPVRVQWGSGDQAMITGSLAAAVPVGDQQTRTMRVRVAVDNAAGQIVPGMSGEAEFMLDASEGTLRVSRDALIRRPDGSTGVWIVNSQDGVARAEALRIETGRSVGQSVEVRSGLSVGDQVVIRGNETLRNGQIVKIVSPTGKPAQ